MLKLEIGKKEVEITIYTKDEYSKVMAEYSMCPEDDALYPESVDHNNIDESLEDAYPELKGMKYIMLPDNYKNPYEAVIYENGEVWIYGTNFNAGFDAGINAHPDTFSNAIVALKMLVAGEDRELNQYDAEKFNADLDFSEV